MDNISLGEFTWLADSKSPPKTNFVIVINAVGFGSNMDSFPPFIKGMPFITIFGFFIEIPI